MEFFGSRAGELTPEQEKKLLEIIDDPIGNGVPVWFLNRQRDYKDNRKYQAVSNTLDVVIRDDLERLKKIK
jgi:ribosomal protein S13